MKNLQISDDRTLLLDGHFCLIDERKNIVELPLDILKDTATSKIILMKEVPYIIRERLLKRDNTDYSVAKLEDFQKREEKIAKKVAFQMDIPLYIYDKNKSYDTLVEFIKK